AVWAGVGIVGMGVVGVLFYGESLNIGTVAGMTFVIIGVCAMLHWTPGDGAETASNQNDPAPAKTYLSTASR
ncbi:MAG: SMR family transporter, partial [Pseudomonadota bacterium]